MGMVLKDSTEVMRGNTHEQVGVGEDRGSKEKDRCPLTWIGRSSFPTGSTLRAAFPVSTSRTVSTNGTNVTLLNPRLLF
jgi:hypothetical protein